jgi:hypothetical protein
MSERSPASSSTNRMRMSLSTYIAANRLLLKIIRLNYKKNINLCSDTLLLLHSIVDEVKFEDAVKWPKYAFQANLKFEFSRGTFFLRITNILGSFRLFPTTIALTPVSALIA